MNTYSKTIAQTSQRSGLLSLSQRYEQFIESIRFAHYGLMTMAILIGTCLGSITTMFVFYNNAPVWQFALGMSFSVANLVVCISQSPTKWMINTFIFSVLVNGLLLLVNII